MPRECAGGKVSAQSRVKKQPHQQSCCYCRWCWYHEQSCGEVVYDGPSGWVCDGRKNRGVANLKSFPFTSKQDCFSSKASSVSIG